MHKATDLETRESVLAILLILLICHWLTEANAFLYIMLAAILLGMLTPALFRPFANLWYSLGALLGNVVSKLIISMLFLFVVIPVGMARKLSNYDPLGLKKWRDSQASVFIICEHRFHADDFDNPY